MGQASCLPCLPGKYKLGSGGTQCQNCAIGRYRNNTMDATTTCEQCDPGFYQNNQGQVSCLKCEIGKYENEQGKSICKICQKGSFSNSIDVAVIGCQSCNVGEFQPDQEQASCLNCIPGMFQNETGEIECQDCPAVSLVYLLFCYLFITNFCFKLFLQLFSFFLVFSFNYTYRIRLV